MQQQLLNATKPTVGSQHSLKNCYLNTADKKSERAQKNEHEVTYNFQDHASIWTAILQVNNN